MVISLNVVCVRGRLLPRSAKREQLLTSGLAYHKTLERNAFSPSVRHAAHGFVQKYNLRKKNHSILGKPLVGLLGHTSPDMSQRTPKSEISFTLRIFKEPNLALLADPKPRLIRLLCRNSCFFRTVQQRFGHDE